jgi:hypothetical protein
MSAKADQDYLRLLGARVLSEANDIKRTPEALAAELGLDIGHLRAVLDGKADRTAAEGVLLAMVSKYPVSLADLWVEPDDTDDGAVICPASASAASSRVFDRKDAKGANTPYYDYRDTAMSRIAPFKPEWIQPIRVVRDANADNPDVAYNKGHLMHQMTFFIGPVNFYWQVDGRSYCAEMNTGDSNFITPFVPHSFTSRDPDNLGLIVAVTYSGNVRRALNDLGRLEPDALEGLAGSLDNPAKAFGARLNRYLAAESLSADELAQRLSGKGIAVARAADLAHGRASPNAVELEEIADQLALAPADLMALSTDSEPAVAVRYAGEGVRAYPPGNQPVAQLAELVRTRRQSGLKGFAMDVVADGRASPFRHGLHQYVYNYGDQPVRLFWGKGRDVALAPGDSAYLRPMVPHSFAPVAAGRDGRLAVVRIPGGMNDIVLDEYASFAPAGRQRVIQETTKWF